jgi:hypothetical protein
MGVGGRTSQDKALPLLVSDSARPPSGVRFEFDKQAKSNEVTSVCQCSLLGSAGGSPQSRVAPGEREQVLV